MQTNSFILNNLLNISKLDAN